MKLIGAKVDNDVEEEDHQVERLDGAQITGEHCFYTTLGRQGLLLLIAPIFK